MTRAGASIEASYDNVNDISNSALGNLVAVKGFVLSSTLNVLGVMATESQNPGSLSKQSRTRQADWSSKERC
jgi:hypothetical protein